VCVYINNNKGKLFGENISLWVLAPVKVFFFFCQFIDLTLHNKRQAVHKIINLALASTNKAPTATTTYIHMYLQQQQQ